MPDGVWNGRCRPKGHGERERGAVLREESVRRGDVDILWPNGLLLPAAEEITGPVRGTHEQWEERGEED
jgi:hypothetical protein